MKIIIKFISFFIQIGLILLVLASVFALITSKTGLINGVKSFVVVSGSMQPEINVGSIVLTVRNEDYGVGDIVSYENEANQVVTHRIITKATLQNRTFYELKGDANINPDNEPVEESSIVGRTYFVLPYAGRLVQKLKTPHGFIGFIIVPAALYIIWELWNIKKELEKEYEKKFQYKYHKVTFT